MNKGILYKLLIVNIYLHNILTQDCPKRVEVGNANNAMCNSELRSFYLTLNNQSKSESLNNKYITVFALKSVSFYTPDKLELIKIIDLNHVVINTFRNEDDNNLYYISDTRMIFKLDQETLSFIQLQITIPSKYSDVFTLQRNFEYMLTINEAYQHSYILLIAKSLAQIIFFHMSIGLMLKMMQSMPTMICLTESLIAQKSNSFIFFKQYKATKELIEKNVEAQKYSERNKKVLIKYSSEKTIYQINLKNKDKKKCQFNQPISQIYLIDNYFIQIQQENNNSSICIITIFQDDCSNLIATQQFNIHKADRIIKTDKLDYENIKFSQNKEKKYLYLFGNNLFVIRFDCSLRQFEELNSTEIKNQIETSDSRITSQDQLIDGLIDGKILSLETNENFENLIVFSTLRVLFVYNYTSQAFSLIKYYEYKISNDLIKANVFFNDKNFVMLQIPNSLQKINILTKKIEYDTRCLKNLQQMQDILKNIHVSQNLDRIYYQNDWGRLLQINRFTGEYEKVIIDLSQKTVLDINEKAERILIGGTSVYCIDYISGKVLQIIEPVWTELTQIVISNINNLVYFIEKNQKVHIFKCQDTCQFTYQLPILNLEQKQNTYTVSQNSKFIIYNYDNKLVIHQLNDLSSSAIIQDIKQVCKNLVQQESSANEVIVFTLLDESNEKIYILTSDSNLIILQIPNLTCINKYSIFERGTTPVSMKISSLRELIFITNGASLIQFNESTGKTDYQIMESIDTKIIDFMIDDNQTFNDVQIIYINNKGQIIQYNGQKLVKVVQVNDKNILKNMIIDTINQNIISSNELMIINYNYQKKEIVNQWENNETTLIVIDYKYNMLIHDRNYNLFIKDYKQSYFLHQQTYEEKDTFVGSFIDTVKGKIYGINNRLQQFDYANFSFINEFKQYPPSQDKPSQIISADLIRELDLLLTFSLDGTMSVWDYDDMTFKSNMQFDDDKCKYPLGGSYYHKTKQYYLRCEGGSVYILQITDKQFKIIQSYENILRFWKVTQIFIVSSINRVFLTGHIGSIYVQDPVLDQRLFYDGFHNGWIYDVVFDSKKKVLLSCGQDGIIQQISYYHDTIVPNFIFQNLVSVKRLFYDADIDIVLAFDIQGNILAFKFSTLSLIKKILTNIQQEYMPFVDFQNNLVIGFSGKKMIVYDYAFILRDRYISWCQKDTSIEGYAFIQLENESEDKKDQIIYYRNDGYLHLWNTKNNIIEYLAYFPNPNSISSNIYFFQNYQLIVITSVQGIFLYDFKERKIIQTDQYGCDKSYIFSKQFIICINISTYSIISIQKDNLGRKFTLIIDKQNDHINGVISLSSQNQKFFTYCPSSSNDLYVFDPKTSTNIQKYINHHDDKIVFLQIYDQYILTFDIQGIIKLVYGENFDQVIKIEDYKGLRVYNIIAFSQSIIYVKLHSSITPFRININEDKIMDIKKGNTLQVNCFGGSSKFYKNSQNVIVMICHHALIYIFKIQDNKKNNILNFEQADLVRTYQLLKGRYLHSFFLTDHLLFIEYEYLQILLFFDNNFKVKKSSSNYTPQSEYTLISKSLEQSDDKATLIYNDNISFKMETWPLLNQMMISSDQESCKFEEQYLSGLKASQLLKQISNIYSDFQKYLNIKKFDIFFNINSNTTLDYPLDFKYKKTSNLKIKGLVAENNKNPIIEILFSKEFIDNCSLYNSFQLENIQINQYKQEDLLFNNFQRLSLINIIFQNIFSSRYIFNNTDFLLIQKLHINQINYKSSSLSQQINTSQIQFLNINETYIDLLELTNCKITSRQDVAIIKIEKSNKVDISSLQFKNNNLAISSLFEISQVEKLKFSNLTIIQNTIGDIIPNFCSLTYIGNTIIEEIEFSNNNQLIFMAYQNFIELLINNYYATLRKAHDIITFTNITFTENNSNKSLMSIISTDVSLKNISFSENNIFNSQLINFDKSKGIIQYSKFKLNHNQDSMIKISNSNLTIQNSQLMNNNVSKSLIEIISSNINLIDSIFENNNSSVFLNLRFFQIDDGCAMRVTNQEENFIQILSNKFQKNKAAGSGGSLFLIGQNIILKDNIFIQNSAGIGGAIRYQQYVPIFMQKKYQFDTKRILKQDTCGTDFNNTCHENTATIFGQNIGSNPRNGRLTFMEQHFINLKDQYKEINSIRSGENAKLQILLLDENGDEVKFSNLDNISQNLKKELDKYRGQILVTEKSLPIQDQKISIQGTDMKEYTKEGFKFDSVLIKGVPGGESKILIQISSIYQMYKDSNEIDFNSLESFDIVMKFRNCIEGEIINKICEGCQFLECKKCETGTYSLVKPSQDGSNVQCKKCDPEKTEKCENKNIVLKKGYWRQNNQTDEIVECVNSKLQCEGTPEKGYCIEGYIGPLCETCDLRGNVWGKSYGKLNQN